MRSHSLFLSSAFAVSLAACGGESGVRLAVTVPQTSALVQSSSPGELVLGESSDELIITSAEVVLREIEFERQEYTGDCPMEPGDDSCEAFEVGPRLVSLPLDGSVDVELSAEIPEGTYDEIEMDVHKLSDDAEDRPLLEAHPDMAELSVRVRGTWNGAPFTYTSDLDEEQELELANPIVVGADGAEVGVTLSIDVATWFVDGSGNLIDPRTALDGGDNEGLVEENIKSSIEGFEDDDHDGIEDEEDDD